MARDMKDIVDSMRVEYTSKSGEDRVIYKFYKKKKRLLEEKEGIIFEMTGQCNEMPVPNPNWDPTAIMNGRFIDKEGNYLTEEFGLAITAPTLKSIKRFDIAIKQGERYSFYAGNPYKTKFNGLYYPVNVNVHSDKDNSKNTSQYKEQAKVSKDIDEIDIDKILSEE